VTIAAYPAAVTVRRRLDAELVRRGLVTSRAQAVEAIGAGRVLVAGSRADRSARLVDPAESLTLTGDEPRYVSRGGDKLAAALAAFAVSPEGRRALDAGASTGGFTDCLLQHGAAAVVAADVGHGQLAWSLRTDPRVAVQERTNVRALEPADIGGAVDLVVADLSFISLATVAPALARCTLPGADLVVLVKPQFEAGRARVGKGGVVRDPDVHRAVLRETRDALESHELVVVGAAASPLRGADGNVEFFFHARRAGDGAAIDDRVDDAALDAVVASVAPPVNAGSSA
jgi:23S rRNA (cytidine1920-2'-O)/16S rRNA (cytidine1409-2'-O)-methyltransferase